VSWVLFQTLYLTGITDIRVEAVETHALLCLWQVFLRKARSLSQKL
jgi:hypothetical protein